jgi:hypothetical protein
MVKEGQIWKSKFDGSRWQVVSVSEKGVNCQLIKADGTLDKWRVSGSSTETFLQFHDLEG